MSHLKSNSLVNEKMLFDPAEHARLKASLVIAQIIGVAGGLLLLASLTMFFVNASYNSQDYFVVVATAVLGLVILIAAIVLDKLSRPRYDRLLHVQKSIARLWHDLNFSGIYVKVDDSITFGSRKYGILTAFKQSEDAWLVSVHRGVSSKLVFEAVLTEFQLSSLSHPSTPLSYSFSLCCNLEGFSQLIQAEQDISSMRFHEFEKEKAGVEQD